MKKKESKQQINHFYQIFTKDNDQFLQFLKFVMALETTTKEDLIVQCQLEQLHSENKLKFKVIRMNLIIDQLKIIMAYRVDMVANMMKQVGRSQLLVYLLTAVMIVRFLIIKVLLINNKIYCKIVEAIIRKNFNLDKDANLKLFNRKDNFLSIQKQKFRDQLVLLLLLSKKKNSLFKSKLNYGNKIRKNMKRNYPFDIKLLKSSKNNFFLKLIVSKKCIGVTKKLLSLMLEDKSLLLRMKL